MIPQQEGAMKANIRYYYAYSFLGGLSFFVPVYIAFLLVRGLSFTQVLSLEAVYSLLAIILEVPTGYFADVKGRKASLLIASASFAVAVILFSFGHSFWQFSAAMVLWAVAGSFKSGADSALLYDTLLTSKRAHHFPKISAIAGFVGMASVAAASIIGGFVADVNLSLPFFLTVLTAVAMTFVVLKFKEPAQEKPLVEKGHLRKLAAIAKEAMKNKVFVYLSGYGVFFVPLLVVLYYLIQPFVLQLGLPLVTLGFLYAAITFTIALGMLIAPRLYHRINIGAQLMLFALLAALGTMFLAMSNSLFGLVLFLLIALATGTMSITVASAINAVIESNKRATTLSISSMISKAAVGVFSVAIGPLLDHYSLRPVMLALAVVSLVGCVCFAALIWRQKIARTP